MGELYDATVAGDRAREWLKSKHAQPGGQTATDPDVIFLFQDFRVLRCPDLPFRALYCDWASRDLLIGPPTLAVLAAVGMPAIVRLTNQAVHEGLWFLHPDNEDLLEGMRILGLVQSGDQIQTLLLEMEELLRLCADVNDHGAPADLERVAVTYTAISERVQETEKVMGKLRTLLGMLEFAILDRAA